MTRTDNINRRFKKLTEKKVSSKFFTAFDKTNKAINGLTKAFSIVPKFKSFEETINYIGTPKVEDDVIGMMAREFARRTDDSILEGMGLGEVEGKCKEAIFRDKQQIRGNSFSSIIIDDVLDEPKKGCRSIESIINKYRIKNHE